MTYASGVKDNGNTGNNGNVGNNGNSGNTLPVTTVTIGQSTKKTRELIEDTYYTLLSQGIHPSARKIYDVIKKGSIRDIQKIVTKLDAIHMDNNIE